MATSNMERAMKEAINKTAQEMYPELNLSEDQVEAIGAVIRGSDSIVNLPVGSGKSLIFHLLPGTLKQLKRPHITIVLVPLNAIIKDQMKKLQEKNVNAIYLNMDGTCRRSEYDEDEDEEDAVDEAEIIFCHPEALLCCKSGSDTLTSLSGRVGVICIDECHKIEEWDYGPETKILDAYQPQKCRPLSPADVLPLMEYHPRHQFLTSSRQHFDNYNKIISDGIFKRCTDECASTREFHRKTGNALKSNEKLPLLTKSALDYRAMKIALSPITPRLLSSLKKEPKYNMAWNKGPHKWSGDVTEAMHSFQWPDHKRLSLQVVRRDTIVDKW